MSTPGAGAPHRARRAGGHPPYREGPDSVTHSLPSPFPRGSFFQNMHNFLLSQSRLWRELEAELFPGLWGVRDKARQRNVLQEPGETDRLPGRLLVVRSLGAVTLCRLSLCFWLHELVHCYVILLGCYGTVTHCYMASWSCTLLLPTHMPALVTGHSWLCGCPSGPCPGPFRLWLAERSWSWGLGLQHPN